MAIDFKAIDAAALPALRSLVQRWVPGGTFEDDEYVVLNPRRKDSSPGSFKINTKSGVWAEFASNDEKGTGAISLWAYLQGIKNGPAARAVAVEIGRPELAPEFKKKDRKKLHPILPVPSDAPGAPVKIRIRGMAETRRWAYKDAQGRLLGYVLRVEKKVTKDGVEHVEKDVVPLTYCRYDEDGSLAWEFKSFPEPRPLYGWDRLVAEPDKSVVMVEGEKTADAAQRLYPQFVVITWPGGSKAVFKAHLEPLRGRKVAFWPDADTPGYLAMQAWDERLRDVAVATKQLTPPDDVEKGWDAADAEEEGLEPAALLETLLRPDPVRPHWIPPENREAHDQGAGVPAVVDGDAAALIAGIDSRPTGDSGDAAGAGGGTTPPPPRAKTLEEEITEEICPLGFDKGTYYYLPATTCQITAIGASNHNKQTLLGLASMRWFSRHFTRLTQAGNPTTDWVAAADALLRACEKRGVFTADAVRGRGAWWEGSDIVYHLGNGLWNASTGTTTSLTERRPSHIYEQCASIPLGQTNPLSASESRVVHEVFARLLWQNKLSATLLAGWCLIAPICGALQWRPHIWITGDRGSGKSWVLSQIHRLTHPARTLQIAGSTSEAYIRQQLKSDALPVLYDESEGQTAAGRERLASMIELLRGASSEGAGKIGRGGPNGRSVAYNIRSCFALSSIYVNLKEAADFSRISILQLGTNVGQRPDEWRKTERLAIETFTPAFSDRLLLRGMSRVPMIQESAYVIASVVRARELGDQRLADQTSILLAGAWSLMRETAITAPQAEKLIESFNWEAITEDTAENDSANCLRYLVCKIVSAEGAGGRRVERTIGELIGIASGHVHDEHMGSPEAVMVKNAVDTLARYTIRVEGGVVSLPTKSPSITRLFFNTNFEQSWSKLLNRLPFVSRTDIPVRFPGLGGARTNKVWALAFPVEYALQDMPATSSAASRTTEDDLADSFTGF